MWFYKIESYIGKCRIFWIHSQMQKKERIIPISLTYFRCTTCKWLIYIPVKLLNGTSSFYLSQKLLISLDIVYSEITRGESANPMWFLYHIYNTPGQWVMTRRCAFKGKTVLQVNRAHGCALEVLATVAIYTIIKSESAFPDTITSRYEENACWNCGGWGGILTIETWEISLRWISLVAMRR